MSADYTAKFSCVREMCSDVSNLGICPSMTHTTKYEISVE